MPNFELSDEEKQLSETARDFARKEIIPVASALDEHAVVTTMPGPSKPNSSAIKSTTEAHS